MKRHGNLFDKIASFENLLLAARKARRGKRFKQSAARFNLNLEKELLRIQRDLLTGAYQPGGYKDFIVYDPKPRLISAAPYRDRVVHHALCAVIEPIFDRAFIHDSYACRKGKGNHAAVDRYTAFAKKNRYVLKCDIRKYFQSIDHDILFDAIQRKIKCPRTLELTRIIIGSRIDLAHTEYFDGDDIFTPYNRNKGIPIGNLTSQFFANVYLNGFDHFIKETLGCRHYIRYVDDFVTLHDDKAFLHEVRYRMEDFLASSRLRLHDRKSRVCRVKDGIRFLGYRVFPTHRLLDKGNALRMRRKMKTMAREFQDGQTTLSEIQPRIQSWIAHAKHADTWRLRRRILGSVGFGGGVDIAAGSATGTTRTTGTTTTDSVAPGLLR
jgi:retron-type reverse transcriptase